MQACTSDLQAFNRGPSVVRGLSMAVMLGPGEPSVAVTLGLGGRLWGDHWWHDRLNQEIILNFVPRAGKFNLLNIKLPFTLGHCLLESCFSSEISKNGMQVGSSLPLSIRHIKIMTKWLWVAKNECGCRWKLRIINNGEKCEWLKQMQVADEKHDSNK